MRDQLIRESHVTYAGLSGHPLPQPLGGSRIKLEQRDGEVDRSPQRTFLLTLDPLHDFDRRSAGNMTPRIERTSLLGFAIELAAQIVGKASTSRWLK
jgi:hypothetical protein